MGSSETPASSDSASSSSSEEERRRRKQKKKEKKLKYKSKDKKSKKSKKRRRYSSPSESSEEEEWVVKDSKAEASVPKPKPAATVSETSAAFAEASLSKSSSANVAKANLGEREEDWMNIIPTFSNDAKKTKRKIEKEEERMLKSFDRPGQHVKELNPYWKDGGIGIPENQEEPSADLPPQPQHVQSSVGDGGLSWLKKSYQRAKEQAKEQNKSIEEIAEERWGSLANFFEMLEKAEAVAKKNAGSQRSRNDSPALRDRDRDRDRGSDRHYDRDRHRDDRPRDRRDRSYERRRDRDRERDRDRDRDRDARDRDRGKGRGGFKRPAMDSDDSGDDGDKDTARSSSASSTPASRFKGSDYDRKGQSQGHVPSWRKASASATAPSKETGRRSPSRSRSRSPDPFLPPKTASNVLPEETEGAAALPEQPAEVVKVNVLTSTELNAINAKIIKAELMGNADTVAELKQKLAADTKLREELAKNGGLEEENPNAKKVITKILMPDTKGGRGGRKLTNKPTETHKDGQRVRYFPDDDKQTLQRMFQKEKMNTAADENALFSRLAGRKTTKTTDEYDLDDQFADSASSSKKVQKELEQEVRRVVEEEKAETKTMEECQWCFDGKNIPRNIIISTGETCYLCVPPFQSLTEGHCLIVPMYHVSASTQLDENVWYEMQNFRRSVVKMFHDNGMDTVIYETVVYLKSNPHMYWECVPMPKETGELAPIYFKKAIQECETEWAQNKKLVDLRERDVRQAIPKGLPYFRVDFGFDNGFAHVIEDEQNFPKNFAQEIIGGMMELDHLVWRKRRHEDFKGQKEKVMKFLKMWGAYELSAKEK